MAPRRVGSSTSWYAAEQCLLRTGGSVADRGPALAGRPGPAPTLRATRLTKKSSCSEMGSTSGPRVVILAWGQGWGANTRSVQLFAEVKRVHTHSPRGTHAIRSQQAPGSAGGPQRAARCRAHHIAPPQNPP